MKYLKRKLRGIGFVFALAIFCPVFISAAEPPKNVLIFTSNDRYIAGSLLADQAIQTTLKTDAPGQFQFYGESLDSFRIETDKYEAEMLGLLKKKYENEKIDLIYALGPPSLKLLLKYEEQLFTGVPKIFLATDLREVAGINLGQNTTGIAGKLEFSPTIDLMLALHPATKRIAVVSGNSNLDKRFLTVARNEFASYANRVEFLYLTDRTIEEFRRELSSLPPDTVVFYISVLTDSAGGDFNAQESLALMTPSSNAPVYGVTQTMIGYGIVGGHLINHVEMGKGAAKIGQRIFAGEKPQNIPHVTIPSVTMFDWRELRKWKINENSLPAGSVIEYKEPTIWELYRFHIAGGLMLMSFQTLLIGWLLFVQNRRRAAEKQRNEYQQLAAAEHQRLDEVVANTPGVVWEARVEPETGARRIQFVSDYIEKMLGYSVEEWLTTPGMGTSLVTEEDRAMVTREMNSLMTEGGERTLQYRWQAKDDRIVWVESNIVAVRDESKKVVGLRGVAMDITKRIEAEEAVRQSEARFKIMADTAPVIVFMTDTNMLCTFFNQYVFDFTGRSNEELLGTGWLEMVHEDDRERCSNIYLTARESLKPFIMEFRALRADGVYRWLYDTAVPRFASDGEFLGYIGTGVDITDRMLAEEKLRAREMELIEAQRLSKIGSWEWNPESDTVNWTEELYRITGRDLSQPAPNFKQLANFYTPESYKLLASTVERALESGAPYTLELEMIRTDKRKVWTNTQGEVIRDNDSKIVKLRGTVQDISYQKMVEQELRNALAEVGELQMKLREENIYLKEVIKLEHNFEEIVGHSEALKYVLFKIEQVAPTDATVLISGETGTGKELVARAIHGASLRKNKPLVKVNCAALSANLIESELFGHERGAFTGANARQIGRFELANGATIFLDEVGELPLELQSKLLRVIQEGEFERLGSSKTIKSDVRIIAATNRNLKQEVNNGNFRDDLLFRLNVFPITVPPLRERREDIPELIEYFVSRFAKKLGKTITSVAPAAMRDLLEYSYPGNIRELANIIERSVINSANDNLRVSEIFEAVRAENEFLELGETLEAVERNYIIQILNNTNWKIEGNQGAARILGLNPSTLRTRINKLGIKKEYQSKTA